MSVTSFRVLSHACLHLARGNTSVIIDPWLSGSCYWRSWWNFPRAEVDERLLADVKYVVLSHIHWDHRHGPTLKRYFRDRTFIIPDEPCERSERDLRGIGVRNIMRVRHGQTLRLGDGIDASLYQFGLSL
ncbi:MAG: MBL fold metallo-hydrolase, partial [Myxococcaceae bacterium]|nr:MBL fold metallo-hydrolase [Myxococcaceae bacterium]